MIYWTTNRRKKILELFVGLSNHEMHILGRKTGDWMGIEHFHNYSHGLRESTNNEKNKTKYYLMLFCLIYLLISIIIIIIATYLYNSKQIWLANRFFEASKCLFAVCISELFQLATFNSQRKWVRILTDFIFCCWTMCIEITNKKHEEVYIVICIIFGIPLVTSSCWEYINSVYTRK